MAKTYMERVLENDKLRIEIEEMAQILNLQVAYEGVHMVEFYGKEGENYFFCSNHKNAVKKLKELL